MNEFIKSMVVDFWQTVAEMSPYLLFGFLMAGVMAALVSQRTVERHLGGRGIWPVVKASLFGVPLPLCSCSVIPVSMSLRKHGASKGATISFLLSTPQTGVDSIFVTLSLLGPVFAIFRPVAAFITGIVGGLATDLLDRRDGTHDVPVPSCSDECCSGHGVGHRFVAGLKHGFIMLPRDIGKPMLVGLVIAAVMSAILPKDFFAEYLGKGIFAMLVMMAVGIPMYVCATASVPLAAAMILKGLTPGAALVFLMTGPATNAASFVTIWKTLGRRVAIIYLGSVAACALAAGLLIDVIIPSVSIGVSSAAGWMLPPAIRNASAVVLLAVLANAILRCRQRLPDGR